MTRTGWAILLPALVVVLAGLVVVVVDTGVDEPVPAAAPEVELPADPCPSTADGAPVRPTRHTDEAPAYGGPPPHPIMLVPVGDAEHAQGYDEAAGHRDIGQGYAADERSLPVEWDTDDGAEAQLVVCEYVASIGNPVQTCQYTGAGQSTLVGASYRYRVIEARTSKPVAEFTVAGGELCPSEVTLWGENASAPPRMLQSASFDALENALRPIVAS